jgi:hypothetical protein
MLHFYQSIRYNASEVEEMENVNDIMSQELYISLDNLIEICNDPTRTQATSLRVYGNYNLIGDIFAISKVSYEKVHMILYFNNSNKKFFVVKKYSSGKYFINFLENVSNDEYIDLSFGFGLTELAVNKNSDGVSNHLYYDYDEKKFVLFTSNGHSIVFNVTVR